MNIFESGEGTNFIRNLNCFVDDLRDEREKKQKIITFPPNDVASGNFIGSLNKIIENGGTIIQMLDSNNRLIVLYKE